MPVLAKLVTALEVGDGVNALFQPGDVLNLERGRDADVVATVAVMRRVVSVEGQSLCTQRVIFAVLGR